MRDTDTLFFRDIVVYARHGVFEAEAALGQRFSIDLDCRLDTRPFAAADDIEGTADYQAIHDVTVEVATGERFRLIEALGHAVALRLLRRFPVLASVAVTVRKPSAPIPGVFSHTGCTIVRDRADLSD